jgi:hypothetical protein
MNFPGSHLVAAGDFFTGETSYFAWTVMRLSHSVEDAGNFEQGTPVQTRDTLVPASNNAPPCLGRRAFWESPQRCHAS